MPNIKQLLPYTLWYAFITGKMRSFPIPKFAKVLLEKSPTLSNLPVEDVPTHVWRWAESTVRRHLRTGRDDVAVTKCVPVKRLSPHNNLYGAGMVKNVPNGSIASSVLFEWVLTVGAGERDIVLWSEYVTSVNPHVSTYYSKPKHIVRTQYGWRLTKDLVHNPHWKVLNYIGSCNVAHGESSTAQDKHNYLSPVWQTYDKAHFVFDPYVGWYDKRKYMVVEGSLKEFVDTDEILLPPNITTYGYMKQDLDVEEFPDSVRHIHVGKRVDGSPKYNFAVIKGQQVIVDKIHFVQTCSGFFIPNYASFVRAVYKHRKELYKMSRQQLMEWVKPFGAWSSQVMAMFNTTYSMTWTRLYEGRNETIRASGLSTGNHNERFKQLCQELSTFNLYAMTLDFHSCKTCKDIYSSITDRNLLVGKQIFHYCSDSCVCSTSNPLYKSGGVLHKLPYDGNAVSELGWGVSHQKQGWKRIYMGLELEVLPTKDYGQHGAFTPDITGGSAYELIAHRIGRGVMCNTDLNKFGFINKHDGSLDDKGSELVSKPMGLEQLKTTVSVILPKFTTIFHKDATENSSRGATYGLHVHITQPFSLTGTAGKFRLAFISSALRHVLRRVGQREMNKYCKTHDIGNSFYVNPAHKVWWSDTSRRKPATHKPKGLIPKQAVLKRHCLNMPYLRERHMAVNLSGETTFEFRHAKSILHSDHICLNIELAHAITMFTAWECTSVMQIDADLVRNFRAYVERNCKTYPYLHKWFKGNSSVEFINASHLYKWANRLATR